MENGESMNTGTKTFGLALAGAALALSSCGSTTDTAALLSFAETLALGDAIDADWGAEPYSDPATLPRSGSATYDGAMTLATFDDGGAIVPPFSLAIIGETQLTADFSGSAISGNARNFVDVDDNRYDGTLAVTDGLIDRDADLAAEFTFDALLDGTLTNSGEYYDFVGIIDGDFVGPNHEAVIGIATGDILSSTGDAFLIGVFGAER